MTGNHMRNSHKVAASVGVEVGTAETYIFYLDQYFVGSERRFLDLIDNRLTRLHYSNCFHYIII